MTWLVALGAATGAVLVLIGVMAPRGAGLARRIDPYLSGLRGRPSTLLVRTRTRDHGPLARLLAPFVSEHDVVLEQRLAAAGSSLTPADFRLEQISWAIAGLAFVAAFGTLASVAGIGLELRAMPVLAVVVMATFFLARDWALGRAIDLRRRRLVDELPVAIDLLTLSIMSGESVGSACGRVADALGDGIGVEFRAVVADIRAGSPVVEALEGLAVRVPDPSAARLVDALCTAVERGSPLVDVLRAQADDVREMRRRSLLEMGGRREVLMLVPVVFLILPTVVVFALFPGLVSLELLVP